LSVKLLEVYVRPHQFFIDFFGVQSALTFISKFCSLDKNLGFPFCKPLFGCAIQFSIYFSNPRVEVDYVASKFFISQSISQRSRRVIPGNVGPYFTPDCRQSYHHKLAMQ